MPADDRGPLFVKVEDAAAIGANAKKFKIEPQRLLYPLRWKHNGASPELHLQLVRDPQLWFDFVATMLFGALRRRAPAAFDWAGMADVTPLLDAFEAARA